MRTIQAIKADLAKAQQSYNFEDSLRARGLSYNRAVLNQAVVDLDILWQEYFAVQDAMPLPSEKPMN